MARNINTESDWLNFLIKCSIKAVLVIFAKMPKTREELTIYCRHWRKTSYNEKRFNKSLREYVETKYNVLFNEFTQFYKELDEANPGSKDITKTKQFKLWKKNHQSTAVRNEQIPERNSENEQIPELNGENEQNPELNGENEQNPELNGENEQIPELNDDENEQNPERNSENEQIPELNGENEQIPELNDDENEQIPEPNGENERDILNEALGGPLPHGNLSIDQLDNLVQGMIEDLQRNDDIRALLNNEELFPPQQEDEGIAMDTEIEIDDLYDARLEEALW